MISLVGLAHTFNEILWSSVSASVTSSAALTRVNISAVKHELMDASSANGKTRLNRTKLSASGMLVYAASHDCHWNNGLKATLVHRR